MKPYDDDYEVLKVLSAKNEYPIVDLAWFEPLPQMLSLIPAELVRTTKLIPIEKNGNHLTVATSDPYNLLALRRAADAEWFENPGGSRKRMSDCGSTP